jgi:pyroglutamyl-peptidase
MKKKVLITGFAPFDRDNINPSGDWIKWLSHRKSPDDRRIHGVILPVSFSGAFIEFKKAFDEFSPDVVILTGLAKNRKELTVERIGINWVDARIPDNDNVTITSQKIDDEGPDGLFSTIEIERLMMLSLETGSVLKLSTSAGEYVCNDLLYKVLCFTKNTNVLVTFIHLPSVDDYGPIYKTLEYIINAL